MASNVYYSADDLAEWIGVSKRIIGEVAGKFSKVITPFAKRQANKRMFNEDEKYIVKFVFDNEDDLTRDGAIKRAIRMFYGIDCKREY